MTAGESWLPDGQSRRTANFTPQGGCRFWSPMYREWLGTGGGKENTLPKILQIAFVFLIPYEECRSRYTNNTERSIQPGMICADYSGREVDACDVSTASFLTQ